MAKFLDSVVSYRKRRKIRKFVEKIYAFFFGVYCPICRSYHKEFSSYGVITRKNARCESCGSLERHRFIYMFLRDDFNLFEGPEQKSTKLNLLHFAPELFFYKIFGNISNLQYFPCDLQPELYDIRGPGPNVLHVDVTDIPFDENSFDYVICSHVLEHVSNDLKAMAELFRVTKKGGISIILVPLDRSLEVTYEDNSITEPAEREKIFGQHDHVRIYGLDFVARLKSTGFKVRISDTFERFSKRERFRYGLLHDQIYICSKE